jgi:hypothetical protein
MDYNSQRPKLIIPEYGRITQKMAEYVCDIPDREKRNAAAPQLIEIMTTFNPQFKNIEEYRQRLWDHLYIMTDYKLDVDSPYPKPDKQKEAEKPEPLPYPRQNIRFRNYGKNVESLLEKIKEISDPEKKKSAEETVAYYMKLVHLQWNNENPSDELIRGDLKMLSGGDLELGVDYNLDNIKGRPAEGTSYRDKEGSRGRKKPFKKTNNRGGHSGPSRPFRKKR